MDGNTKRPIPKFKIPNIKGAKFLAHNAKFIISTGVPSIDHNLNGGLAVGSLILLEEDVCGTVAKTLLKYYLAEGIVSKQNIFLASQDFDPQTFYEHHLPDQVKPEDDYVPEYFPDEKMKIAWRYQNLKQHSKVPIGGKRDENSFGHYYDLSSKMKQEELMESKSTFWNNNMNKSSSLNTNTTPDAYDDLFSHIKETVENGGYFLSDDSKLNDECNLLRIGIHSIGSPLWDLNYDNKSLKKIIRFFYLLRTLVRSSLAVAFITIPSHLFQDSDVIKRIQHLCDVCIRIESFSGSIKETNPLFKDYHGLFHMIKQAPINTLETHLPDSFDLAYRTLRKRFIIEKLHLPPELEITRQREQEDDTTAYSISCASASKTHLEF